MNMQGYRVAVLGAGKIGGVHLRAAVYADGLTPVAIADAVIEAADRQAACYCVKAYGNYREMIDRERPDIAVIALPPYLHQEAVEYCADRGCHILLEKPMARTVQECEAINRAAARGDVRLMVGHSMHVLEENRVAKQVLDSGELGRLLMMNHVWHMYYYNDRLDWFFDRRLSGGGIAMNLGSHAVDLVQWMSASRVKGVRASLHYAGYRGDIEAAGTAMLETESGVAASVTLYGYQRVPKSEIELLCERGVIRIVAGQGVWVTRNDECSQVWSAEGSAAKDIYSLQLEALAQMIEAGAVTECDGAYGQTVIEAVEAIYRSHASGTRVEVERRQASD